MDVGGGIEVRIRCFSATTVVGGEERWRSGIEVVKRIVRGRVVVSSAG